MVQCVLQQGRLLTVLTMCAWLSSLVNDRMNRNLLACSIWCVHSSLTGRRVSCSVLCTTDVSHLVLVRTIQIW